MRCNLVLEGGGAKGLAHIGALKAIDDYKINIGNVSGTSAGAIAVALFAAGYSPDEMYNPKTGKGVFPDNLFKIILKNKKDKLSFYFYISLTITYLLILTLSIPYFLTTFNFAIFITVYTLTLAIFYNIKKAKPPIKAFFETLTILALIITLSPMILLSIPFFWHFGLISTNGVREWLKETLSNAPKLKGVKDIDNLTLGEFYDLTNVNLKIIATDLTEKKLIAFSGDNNLTKDIKLIDSIIASMCIPIIFKCCDIDSNSEGCKSRFVDGGMLSNFPAWVHRKNLLMSELTHTIGIKIFDNQVLSEENISKLDTPLSYIKSIVHTALWGSSSIENISVRALVNIGINTGNVTTLKFNISDIEKKELYNSSYKQTISCLEKNYTLFPSNKIKSWLQDISEFIGLLIFQNKYGDIKIRSSISSYVDTELNVSKLIHTYNMNNDLDKHLEFEYEEGVSGISLRTGQPLSYLTQKRKVVCLPGLYLTSPQKKRLDIAGSRSQLINKNVDFILSIPLFDPEDLTEKEAFYYTEGQYDGYPLIDFNIVTKEKITAKACLNIDFSGITVLDEEKNDVLFSYLNTQTYHTMLRLLSGIGTIRISELSKFKKAGCHYEIN